MGGFAISDYLGALELWPEPREINAALPIESRQDADGALLADTHVGILSINDRGAHMYFHFVGSGRDPQNLRMIVECCFLSGLQTIYEDDRTHWGAGHNDLCRIRHLRSLRAEPTAGR
jgi:hypothetical protein